MILLIRRRGARTDATEVPSKEEDEVNGVGIPA